MSPRSPRSRLSADDLALWARITAGVAPLRWRPAEPPASAPVRPEPQPDASHPRRTPVAAPQRPPPSPPPRPLVALDERARRRLSNGRSEPDGRIDLHGLHQQQAFSALIGFLRHHQARGGRVALVITGRGGDAMHDSGRGVLRTSVPHWLGRPEFRDLVLGVEPAARRHGGDGALYVRVRRRRDG